MSENTGRNKPLIILLVILIVLMLLGAAGFGYFYVYKGANVRGTSSASPIKIEEKTTALDEFVVNLADENKCYIKIKIVLAYTDKKLDKEITSNMHEVRDAVNTTLRSKKSADFNNGGEAKVMKELVDKLNTILTTGKITNIYIYDIVIQ